MNHKYQLMNHLDFSKFESKNNSMNSIVYPNIHAQ